jgi:heme exporter protein B
VIARDLKVSFRRRSDIVNPILFFVIVTALFPLGVGPEPATLRQIGPGIVWVAALLATLLSLDSMFRSDFDDGSLELFVLSPVSTTVIVQAKVIAHWLTTGLPIIIVAPLIALLLAIPGDALVVLLVTLLLGTPTLSLIGAIGVALTVGLGRGSGLLSLLVLPLYIPVLIFGAHAVDSAAAGLPALGQIYFLGALFFLALTLAPLAAAAALKISVN